MSFYTLCAFALKEGVQPLSFMCCMCCVCAVFASSAGIGANYSTVFALFVVVGSQLSAGLEWEGGVLPVLSCQDLETLNVPPWPSVTMGSCPHPLSSPLSWGYRDQSHTHRAREGLAKQQDISLCCRPYRN